MRRHTAARKGEGGGWHYVSLSSRGGHPLGYCWEHDPHETETEARECYARYLRDHVTLDGTTLNWQGCAAPDDEQDRDCDRPTKKLAQVSGSWGHSAALCDKHLTLEIAYEVMGLLRPAGDAWMS